MNKLIAIILSLVVCLCCFPTAYAADSSVEYNNAGEFVFNPTSKDLFQDFKDVMPGDRVEQKIVIKNTKTEVPVTIYLKAEIDEEYKDFLNQMDLDIYYSKTLDGERFLLQSGRASETGKLTVNTKLGTFNPSESGYIFVVLYVYPEMNNEYKNTAGKIKWIFTVEEGERVVDVTEPSVEDPDFIIPGKNPTTGVTYLAAGIALAVVAASGIGIIMFKKKSKDSDEDET